MTDKLAEEILAKFIEKLDYTYRYKTINERNNIINELRYLMQAYHEAKMKESKIIESFERENQYVTDEDIEAFASLQSNPESEKDFERGLWLGIKVGAKAMQNGEIKHNG
jgi:hypothetical protein